MRKILVLSLACGLLATFDATIRAAHPCSQKAPDAEEYAVYSALLNEVYSQKRISVILIIQTSLISYNRLYYAMEHMRAVSKQTFADFESKNKSPVAFDDLFSLDVKHELLDKGVFEVGPRPGGYIVGLSRVGFNHKRDQALVFVIENCGGNCGKDSYVLLTKKGGRWRIKDSLMTVIR